MPMYLIQAEHTDFPQKTYAHYFDSSLVRKMHAYNLSAQSCV